MSYIIFARKYRPKAFDEIIGQPHITTTLKNAVSQARTAHAYLFSGPRGIGKTTTARILAKALNCEKASRPDPCNSCTSCLEITKGSSLDVLEIDGASNRGIDEIRNLRDNVKFAPSGGRYKIYIIDEVHMLTPEAFNALLKTLEEPPKHVKFIFATTQSHKVPPTILSRCQRFDFRRISTKDILGNLKSIADKEGLNVKDEVLSLIARYADGSMRDGQIILDQITSFAHSSAMMDVKELSNLLGVLDEEVLFSFSKFIKDKDAPGALKMIETLVEEGKDVTQAVFGLIEHFRNILVAKINNSSNSLIDLGQDKAARYIEEADGFTIEEILYIIYTLSNTIDLVRKSGLGRIPFEISMVKLTRLGSMMPLTELIKRLDILEKETKETREMRETGPGPILPDAKKDTSNEPEGPISQNKTLDLDEVSSSWTSVLNHVKAKKISIGSYLEEGYPEALESGVLTIGFPKEFQFHKEVLESVENRRLIEESLRSVLKAEFKLGFTLVEPVKLKNRIPKDAVDERSPADEETVALNKTKEVDPIIKTALDVFSGEITKEETRKTRLK